MVIEGRRDQSRTDIQQPEQVAIRGRPGMLAAGDEAVAHRDLARADARSPVDLALAPAALTGVAHQTARPMEPEAPRQDGPARREERYGKRLALGRLDRPAIDVDADPAPRGERRRVHTGR